MPRESAATQGSGILFGEGDDDVAFLKGLLEHLGIRGIRVEPYIFTKPRRGGGQKALTGKDALTATLKALPMTQGFGRVNRIGVIRDLDEDPLVDVMTSIRNALQGNPPKSDRPPAPTHPGEIAEEGRFRVGVFLFPGDGRTGCLEDLCLDAIRTDPAWPCINSYFECLDRSGLIRPSLGTMKSKARFHAWLASRERANFGSLAVAAEAGAIPWDHAAFDPLKTFLRTLFAQPAP